LNDIATKSDDLRYRAIGLGVLSRVLVWSIMEQLPAYEVNVVALAGVLVFALGIILLGSLMLTDRRTTGF
jgi:hypothetical protein